MKGKLFFWPKNKHQSTGYRRELLTNLAKKLPSVRKDRSICGKRVNYDLTQFFPIDFAGPFWCLWAFSYWLRYHCHLPEIEVSKQNFSKEVMRVNPISKLKYLLFDVNLIQMLYALYEYRDT